MSVICLKIDDVKTDGMQVRAKVYEETVQEYIEAIGRGVVLPPAVVFNDGTFYWLADGFHRFEAWKRTGCESLTCEVKDGPKSEALKFAFSANGTHGLRMTNEDKRNAVLVAYENRAALGLGDVPSARAIAECVGVSDHTAMNELRNLRSWNDAQARTGSDGKTRKLAASVSPKECFDKKTGGGKGRGDRDDGGGKAGKGKFKPDAIAAAAKEIPSYKKPAHMTDMVGKDVPASLGDVWMRRTEISDLVKSLQKIKQAVTKAQDENDPLWGTFNFSSSVMHLDRAIAAISGAVPHCVCMYCAGIGCKSCVGGLMALAQYERLPRSLMNRKP